MRWDAGTCEVLRLARGETNSAMQREPGTPRRLTPSRDLKHGDTLEDGDTGATSDTNSIGSLEFVVDEHRPSPYSEREGAARFRRFAASVSRQARWHI